MLATSIQSFVMKASPCAAEKPWAAVARWLGFEIGEFSPVDQFYPLDGQWDLIQFIIWHVS